MKIKVKLFASLREALGYAERDMEIYDGQTLHEVWKQITGDVAQSGEVLMAINMDYANPEARVKDGDEVAFFPPVTGG
jgi:molybdopterin synthase sulfur carrier subunit